MDLASIPQIKAMASHKGSCGLIDIKFDSIIKQIDSLPIKLQPEMIKIPVLNGCLTVGHPILGIVTVPDNQKLKF